MKTIMGIEVEEKSVMVTDISKGDLYIGERNTGPKLLTCDKVVDNCVYPVENAYPYYTWECFKVKE